MKRPWTILKDIIGTYEQQKGILLSVIDEKGQIVCANANMIKTLHLKNPRVEKINFFDLLHPVNLSEFKTALDMASESAGPILPMEVYLKNGYYHPMKWEINYIKNIDGSKSYLCVGHKLLDDNRLRQFNILGEKNYQLIVEGINAGILFQDKKGELIAVNQKLAEVLNTTLERLYKLTDIEDLWNTTWNIAGEDGDPIQFENTPFMQALKTGKQQTQVLVFKLRSGEYRWLHFTSQPLFEDNNTQPYSVVTNVVDLTYEKQLVLEIQERKALFRSFMSQTPNLTWVVDESSTLLFASDAFYKYFGLTEKTALNKKIEDILPAAVKDSLFQKHVEVLESGKASEFTERVKWADGTELVFHINIFPINEVSGTKLLGGHAVNLSDKHNTERKLRETNDRLLLLTRATSDAIWEWDMQTGYIFRNDALMDIIGYQVDDPRGLSWWLRRIHPEDRNRVSDKVKDSTDKNQQSWQDEYRFKCADGNYKFMRDKGYIVYENGLPVKMIGSLQDVTSIKQLESQLIEEKLERQKEISEMVIHVQEKERTRIGHELHDNVNQILSTTKLFVDMLTPANKEEKLAKQKSLDYILMAIEEIRKLSKELVVPHLKNNGLIPSIETVIDDIHLTTALKIKFVHDSECDLLTPGKKVALFRIIQEQLKNILKHSHAKQVEISLRTKERDVCLVIKDNGIGFDPHQTKRGIGLANIYERTRFYNGSADIQTKHGAGCILTVTIPAT
jgi:PAS domain S-box-containing protein